MSSAPGPRSGDSRPRLVVATAVLLSMGALTGIYATWTGYHAYMAAREDRVVTRVVTAAQTAVVALDAEANAARAQGGAPPGAAAETDASFAEVADAAGAVPPLTPSEPRGPAIALLDDPMGSLERARSADPDASAPATEAGASYASLTHGAATVSAAYAELLLDPSLAAYVTGFLGPPTTDMAASAVLVDFASEFVNDATSAAQSIFSAALARLIVTLGATLLAAGGLLFAVRHWLRHRRQAASRAPARATPAETAAPFPVPSADAGGPPRDLAEASGAAPPSGSPSVPPAAPEVIGMPSKQPPVGSDAPAVVAASGERAGRPREPWAARMGDLTTGERQSLWSQPPMAGAVPPPPVPPILVQPGQARLAPSVPNSSGYGPLVHQPPLGRATPGPGGTPRRPDAGGASAHAALAPGDGPFSPGASFGPEVPTPPPMVSYPPGWQGDSAATYARGARPTSRRPALSPAPLSGPVAPVPPPRVAPSRPPAGGASQPLRTFEPASTDDGVRRAGMAPPAVASADTPTADVPLDAMVTRMQRHAEALIALARAGEADADAEPGRIDDIIVAAATRVGASGRVRMRAETVPAIQAPFVETLRHLLVEVLDNAARFSPEDQPITVTVGLIRGGAMLQITDSGPGMTAADFAEATRVMTTGASPAGPHHQGPHIGLAVVARAATMLGAHVRISPVRSHRGTQVAIALPQAIFAASHPATLPRSMQAPPPTLGVAPRRTARHAQPVAEAPSGTVRAPEHLSRPSHRFEAPAARRTGSHRGRDDPWERDG